MRSARSQAQATHPQQTAQPPLHLHRTPWGSLLQVRPRWCAERHGDAVGLQAQRAFLREKADGVHMYVNLIGGRRLQAVNTDRISQTESATVPSLTRAITLTLVLPRPLRFDAQEW